MKLNSGAIHPGCSGEVLQCLHSCGPLCEWLGQGISEVVSKVVCFKFKQALLQAVCFRALKDASDSAHRLIIPSSLFCSSKCEVQAWPERLKCVSSLAIIGAGLCIWRFISTSEILESIRHHRHYTKTQKTHKNTWMYMYTCIVNDYICVRLCK